MTVQMEGVEFAAHTDHAETHQCGPPRYDRRRVTEILPAIDARKNVTQLMKELQRQKLGRWGEIKVRAQANVSWVYRRTGRRSTGQLSEVKLGWIAGATNIDIVR